MQEFQNSKKFLQKITLKSGLKKILWLKKAKNTVPLTCVIKNLNGEEIAGTIHLWKKFKRQIKKSLALKS